MSYLDPQSWDDVDGGGNPTTWNNLGHCLWYPRYEMLRRALSERVNADVRARAPGQIYAKGIDPLAPGVGVGWKSAVSGRYFKAFDTSLLLNLNTNRLADFLYPSDVTGLTAKPVALDKDLVDAFLLAEFGEELVDYTFGRLALWTKQRYEILNRMRYKWTGNPFDSITGVPSVQGEIKASGYHSSWSAAVSAFNAITEWTAMDGFNQFANSASHWAQSRRAGESQDIDYQIVRTRMRFKWNFATAPQLPHTIYSRLKAPAYFFFSGDYENNDYPAMAENTFVKSVDNELPINSESIIFELGNLDNATVSQPPAPALYVNTPTYSTLGWESKLSPAQQWNADAQGVPTGETGGAFMVIDYKDSFNFYAEP